LALRVPLLGVICSAAAMMLVAVGYGELLRHGSEGDWTSRPGIGRIERAWRLALYFMVGLFLTMPMFTAWRTQSAPRFTTVAVVVAAFLGAFCH
jgi:predicted histidine transporter YuiF (NhaC family)